MGDLDLPQHVLLTEFVETLEKFNFRGFVRSRQSVLTNRLQIERKLIDLTPLSIAHPMQPVKPPAKTFEQRIKDKSFGKKEETVHKFDQHYREAVAVKEKNPSASSASYLKRRASRSDASLKHTKDPESFSRKCGRRELCSSKPEQLSDFSRAEAPVPAITNKTGSSNEVPAIDECIPSPFASLGTNSALGPFGTTSESALNSKASLPISAIYPAKFEKDFRKVGDASDADDERDASGLETESEDEDPGKDLSSESNDVANQDRDDGGLHVEFKEVTINKKRHINDDDDDDGYHSGDCCGATTNNPENSTTIQSKDQKGKERSTSGGQTSAITHEGTDQSTSRTGSIGSCNESNIRKDLVAHQAAKRLKI